jgi:AcrR family transcriptional regulator
MPSVRSRPSARRPPPAGQPRGDATRARLLGCAHAQFLRRGYHATSMRAIAQAAGVAVGGIYNHYASKEEIFAAVLDAYHPYHVIFPALEQTEGETVEAFVRNAMAHFKAAAAGIERDLVPLMFVELVEFQGRHLREMAARFIPTVLAFVQRFGRRKGRLRQVSQLAMMRALISLLIGYLVTESVLKDTPLLPAGRRNQFDDLIEIYLHGIAAAEA